MAHQAYFYSRRLKQFSHSFFSIFCHWIWFDFKNVCNCVHTESMHMHIDHTDMFHIVARILLFSLKYIKMLQHIKYNEISLYISYRDCFLCVRVVCHFDMRLLPLPLLLLWCYCSFVLFFFHSIFHCLFMSSVFSIWIYLRITIRMKITNHQLCSWLHQTKPNQTIQTNTYLYAHFHRFNEIEKKITYHIWHPISYENTMREFELFLSHTDSIFQERWQSKTKKNTKQQKHVYILHCIANRHEW